MPCHACGVKNSACLCTTVSSSVIAIVLSQVPLKRGRAELHVDTKNKTKRAEMTDVEMTKILAAYD